MDEKVIYAADFGVDPSASAEENSRGLQVAVDAAMAQGVQAVLLPPGAITLGPTVYTGSTVLIAPQ